MTDNPSTLTPTQAARLRAADGVATSEDVQILSDEGLEEDDLHREQNVLSSVLRDALAAEAPEGDLWPAIQARLGLAESAPSPVEVRQALLHDALAGDGAVGVASRVVDALGLAETKLPVGDALRTHAGPSPDVSGAVLDALGAVGVPTGAALRDAAGPAPDLSDAVASALGHAESEPDVGAVLRAAAGEPPDLAARVLEELGAAAPELGLHLTQAAGPAPDVSDAVLSQLGLAAAPVELGAALRAAAGPTPVLQDAVADAVQAQPLPTEGEGTLHALPRRHAPVWPVVACGALAVAAALLFYVSPSGSDAEPVSFELAAVNEVEIEDLTVGDDAMVQVLQFEEDAPTIIFVDVPEEAPATGNEGTTL